MGCFTKGLTLSLVNFSIVQGTNVALVYVIDAYRPVAGEITLAVMGFKCECTFQQPTKYHSGHMLILGNHFKHFSASFYRSIRIRGSTRVAIRMHMVPWLVFLLQSLSSGCRCTSGEEESGIPPGLGRLSHMFIGMRIVRRASNLEPSQSPPVRSNDVFILLCAGCEQPT